MTQVLVRICLDASAETQAQPANVNLMYDARVC